MDDPEGSSPLARGTQSEAKKSESWKGLIPARAGNTDVKYRGINGDRAHPRSRGEHSEIRTKSTGDAGSSPLARGTRPAAPICAAYAGLIPARAGNTYSSFSDWLGIGAHPRSRGEHLMLLYVVPPSLGSSPLARGTLIFALMSDSSIGLIPARAGNTPLAPPRKSQEGAHPRSRGEHR